MNLEPKKTLLITATMLSLMGDVPVNNSDSAAIRRNLYKNFFSKTLSGRLRRSLSETDVLTKES